MRLLRPTGEVLYLLKNQFFIIIIFINLEIKKKILWFPEIYEKI